MDRLGLILLGAPASGKGTQSKLVCNKHNFLHISTGEIFRVEMDKKSDIGRFVKFFVNYGNLVPDYVTIELLEEFLSSHKGESFLFDGFPRTKEQAKWLLDYLKSNDYLIKVISMDVDERELEKRMRMRSSKERRSDDNLEAFRIRMDIFHKQRDIVFDLFKEYVEVVDGNLSVSLVFSQIEKKLG